MNVLPTIEDLKKELLELLKAVDDETARVEFGWATNKKENYLRVLVEIIIKNNHKSDSLIPNEIIDRIETLDTKEKAILFDFAKKISLYFQKNPETLI